MLTTLPAQAEGPTPSPSAISIPAGPASLEGFGPAYDLGPGSALPSLTIPLSLSSLPGAIRVPLALQYAPGTGVSDFGVDWSLGIPSIERSRTHGLPEFAEDDVLALRGSLGSDDLVRVSPGELRLKTTQGEVLRVLDRGSEGFWLVLADGARWELGARADDVDLGQGPEASGVYRWRASRYVDARGQVLELRWSSLGDETPSLMALELAGTPLALRVEYEARPDITSERYYGVTLRRAHRVSRIAWTDGPSEIWSWSLQYADAESGASVGATSWLASVQQVAADGTRAPSWQMEAVDAVMPVPSRSHQGVGIDPFAPGRALVDVTGDGVPDILDGSSAGAWSLRRGTPTGFLGAQDLASSPSTTLLDARILDVNGDAVADVMTQSSEGLRVYYGGGAQPFSQSADIAFTGSLDLLDPRLVVADLDLDRHVDLLLATETQTYIWTHLDEGGTHDAQTLAALPSDLRPGLEGVEVIDMDGDGLVDLVRLRRDQSRVDVAYGVGRGDFLPAQPMTGVPDLGGDARWQLRDVDSDGAVDLVRLGSSEIRVHHHRGNLHFTSPTVIAFPGLDAGDNAEIADIDADGALDLLRVTGDNDSSVASVIALSSARPGLIRAMQNSLGGRVEFVYSSAAMMAEEDRAAGQPWSFHAPFAMPVLARVIKSDLRGWSSQVEHRVHDAYFDPRAMEWRGFGSLIEAQAPSNGESGYRKERVFDLGIGSEARKNLPLSESEGGFDGSSAIRTESMVWTVHQDSEHPQLALVSRTALDVIWHEAGDAAAERIRTEFEHDEWGNVVIERAYGRIDVGTGADLSGDEAFRRYTYATPTTDAGPRNRASVEEAFSADGQRLAATRTRYDGAGDALPLGQVDRGLWTVQQSWIEEDTWQLIARSTYDANGNLTSQTDGEGTQVATTWDEFGLYPVQELRSAGAQSEGVQSYEQVVHATWDRGRGVLTSRSDARGQLTRLEHDGLSRLLALARPGDSLELPTVRYRYDLEAGSVAIRKELRRESGGAGVERSTVHLDGWGRALATVTQDDAGVGAVVEGATQLSAAGRVILRYEPFFADASALNPGSLPTLLGGRPSSIAVEESRYDAIGRVIETRAMDGRRERNIYEPLGMLTVTGGDSSDQAASGEIRTRTRFDGLGRVLEVQELGEQTIRSGFEWSGQGQLLRYLVNGVSEIEWFYDGSGNNIEIDARDAGLWTRAFNGRGQEVLRIDGDGHRLETEYDGMGRVLVQRGESGFDGGLTLRSWRYDGQGALSQRGLLTSIIDESGTAEFEWDERGRLSRSVRRFAEPDGMLELSEHRRYDAQDRLTELVYADGSILSTTYGSRGQVSSLGEVVPWVERDAAARPLSLQLGDSIHRRRIYDASGRWLSQSVLAGDDVVADVNWNYDARGLVTKVQDLLEPSQDAPDLSAVFEHDQQGRLTRATGGFGDETYAYDAEGDLRKLGSVMIEDDSIRTRLAGFLGQQSLVWSPAGRLLSVTGINQGVGAPSSALWSWDARGELVDVSSELGRSASTYDENGVRNTYLRYDASGRLVSSLYVMDEYQELEDDMLVRWVWLDGERVASLPVAAPKGGWPARPIP